MCCYDRAELLGNMSLNALRRLQITDISQLGTPQQVAQLVLPRDVRVLSTVVSKTALPPKDTGTVLGVVDRDPVTTYRRADQDSVRGFGWHSG